MIIDFITRIINQFLLDLNAPLENLGNIFGFFTIFPFSLFIIMFCLTLPVCQLLVVPYLHLSSLRLNRKGALWKKFLNVHLWDVNKDVDDFTWSILAVRFVVYSIIYFVLEGWNNSF